MRYQIRHAIVKYAADTILVDVNFEIHDHEKIAIIGRNGCGKTTLLKLISGEVEMANPDSDEECGIVMAGKQRIGYLRLDVRVHSIQHTLLLCASSLRERSHDRSRNPYF